MSTTKNYFHRLRQAIFRILMEFGVYIAHLFLIHALAVGFAWATTGDIAWLFGSFPDDKPAGYGLGLPGVYAVWIAVMVALYPLCRWFAAIKRRRREWFWTYL